MPLRLRGRERRILLRALRHPVAPADPRGLPSADEATWERVFSAAAQLGVAPLLYVRVKRPAWRRAVPPATLQRHRGDLVWTQARNMKLFAELRDLLALLRARGIDVIALKGAALAELVYSQLGLRTMGDVDLLVRRADLPRVQAALEETGFQADESYRPAAWYQTRHHHLVPYVARDGVLKLDIHHDITKLSSRIRVPAGDLWARAQAVRIASIPCSTLSWEHMLLHLALHMADQNRFVGDLRGLCDVAEIVSRFPGTIDWDELLRTARTWGAVTPLFLALSVARAAVGAAVPSPVLRELRRHVSMPPVEQALLRFLCLRAALISERSQHVVYDWILLDVVRGRLKNRSRVEVLRDVTHGVAQRLMGRWREAVAGASGSVTRRMRTAAPPSLAREHELLLRATLGRGPAAIDAWREWREAFDLSAIDAQGYALLPQLYVRLRALDVQDASLAKLRGIYRHTWCQNRVVLARMARTFASLHERGIGSLVLDGSALVTAPELGLLPLERWGFLVPGDRFPAAAAVLRQAGWSQQTSHGSAGAGLGRFTDFTHPDGTTCAVYRSLFAESTPSWADEDCWRHAAPSAVHDVAVRVLSSTDQLLRLLVDLGSGSRAFSPRWVAEVATLVTAAEQAMDWERLRSKCAALRLTLPVKRSAAVLQALPAFRCPSELRRLADTLATTWAERREDARRRRDPAVRRGAAEAIAAHWCRYKRVTGEAGRLPGFVWYLQEAWELPSVWLLPLAGIGKWGRQLTGAR